MIGRRTPPAFDHPMWAEALIVATQHVRYMRARGSTCADICASVGITKRGAYGIAQTTERLARMWMTMQLKPAQLDKAA